MYTGIGSKRPCKTVSDPAYPADYTVILFFADVLAVWAAGGNILLYMISGIVLINMVPELILNVVFSPVAERIYRVVKK